MSGIVWIVVTCLQPNKETSPTPSTYSSYEQRLQDYKQGIPSIVACRKPEEKLFLTENTGRTSSFLDEYGFPVHYTNTQTEMFHENQGKKEFTDIRTCLDANGISDDTMVIKVTGRYIIQSSWFPEIVREHVDKDVVYCPHNAFKNMPPHPFPDCILGMIAMKARHWRALPLHEITRNNPTEWFIAKYITNNIPKERRHELSFLDIAVKIGASPSYWTV